MVATLDELVNRMKDEDVELYNHGEVVAQLSKYFGERLKFGNAELEYLYYGAVLHDVGKLGVPDQYRYETKVKSDLDLAIYMYHVSQGLQVVASLTDNVEILSCVAYHHIRDDGQGFHNMNMFYPVEYNSFVKTVHMADQVINHFVEKTDIKPYGNSKRKSIIEADSVEEYFDMNRKTSFWYELCNIAKNNTDEITKMLNEMRAQYLLKGAS